MASLMAVLIFVTVALVVFTFGAAALAPTSVLGSRLRALGWQRPQSQQKPAIRERLEHALDPLSKALPRKLNRVIRYASGTVSNVVRPVVNKAIKKLLRSDWRCSGLDRSS